MKKAISITLMLLSFNLLANTEIFSETHIGVRKITGIDRTFFKVNIKDETVKIVLKLKVKSHVGDSSQCRRSGRCLERTRTITHEAISFDATEMAIYVDGVKCANVIKRKYFFGHKVRKLDSCKFVKQLDRSTSAYKLFIATK